MSTREIVNAFDEWYGAEISPTLVSRVTNAVIEQVVEWQSRPLDAIYPIVYLDGLNKTGIFGKLMLLLRRLYSSQIV